MGIVGIVVLVLVGAGALYLGVTTGVLWTLLGGLFTAIGKAIGALVIFTCLMIWRALFR